MVQLMTLGDHFIEPEALRATGRVTIAFGQLEHVLKLLVKRFLDRGFDEGMAYAERLATIQALRNRCSTLHGFKGMDQAREAEFDDLLTQADDLYRRRNSVVHAVWALDHGGKVVRVYRGADLGSNVDELNGLADAAQRVAIRLNDFGR